MRWKGVSPLQVDQFGRIVQRGPNIFFAHSIFSADLFYTHTPSQTANDTYHWHPSSSNYWSAMLDLGIEYYPVIHEITSNRLRIALRAGER